MAQFPIISGIYTDQAGDFRTSYPVNMVPVPKDSGISKGYLRPADGIVQVGAGPGTGRGGIVWNGAQYRAMGDKLVRVDADGTVAELGVLAGSGQVTFDYSFDRLIIAAGELLYYWNGTLAQVTDPDLGVVKDALFIDGYTMTTDGTSLVVADLNDPTSVNPLKYGSSEVDPDQVVGLLKMHNEVYALNRYTIEVFNNVGGSLFPFERNEGAHMQRGVIGTYAAAVYTQGDVEVIAFLGSGRNEPPSIWIGVNSTTSKIATREIDTLLQNYTEADLSQAVLETRIDKAHALLYVHLPDRTLVYDSAASSAVGQQVWFVLTSSISGTGQYRARNLLWANDAWYCDDPESSAIGRLDGNISTHYGARIGWEFSTSIIYNDSFGAIFHALELVALPGRVTLGADPVIWTAYSTDGDTWSQERACRAGGLGNRHRRLTWLRQGHMHNWRIQRFRGTSDAHLSVARLEVQVEALNA